MSLEERSSRISLLMLFCSWSRMSRTSSFSALGACRPWMLTSPLACADCSSFSSCLSGEYLFLQLAELWDGQGRVSWSFEGEVFLLEGRTLPADSPRSGLRGVSRGALARAGLGPDGGVFVGLEDGLGGALFAQWDGVLGGQLREFRSVLVAFGVFRGRPEPGCLDLVRDLGRLRRVCSAAWLAVSPGLVTASVPGARVCCLCASRRVC